MSSWNLRKEHLNIFHRALPHTTINTVDYFFYTACTTVYYCLLFELLFIIANKQPLPIWAAHGLRRLSRLPPVYALEFDRALGSALTPAGHRLSADCARSYSLTFLGSRRQKKTT